MAIQNNYLELKKGLEDILNSLVDKKDLEWHMKNTKMSIKNLISYLLWWWELVLKWIKKYEENEKINFPEKWYKWNELWKLAQKFYEDYENIGYRELKEDLDKNVDKIIELIRSYNNEALYESLWYEKYTLWRMVQFNTSSPYKNAKSKIRKWKNNIK